MSYYSFCANISENPRERENAELVSITRLITESKYLEEMRQIYEQIVSSPTSIGPIFEVTTGSILKRTINVEGPVFRVIETIERSHKPLGDGSFGVVHLGFAYQSNGKQVYFALKSFKELDPNKRNETKKYIFEEIKSYARLEHENIIKFYGVLFTPFNNETKMEIIMEAMNKGSLWSYLNSRYQPVHYSTQLYIALQLARGLEYMSEKGFVHRDIAARNCLLHQKNPGGELIAKIGDMGLTRKLYTRNYYRRQDDISLTVRWMSPENIENNKFTTSSDCWAFGIMLWEIATGCKYDPYHEFGRIYKQSQLASLIISGQTMSKPKDCPDEFYNIMKSCWSLNPHERCDITMVRTQLETLLSTCTVK